MTRDQQGKQMQARRKELLAYFEIKPAIPADGMRKAAAILGPDHERTLEAMVAAGIVMESEGTMFVPASCR